MPVEQNSMRGIVSHKSLYNGMYELCRSINLLHSNSLLLPALMMTYATIDILSSLACSAQESSGSDFRDWVNRYLLPHSQLCCTAEDLWSARCSLLHTYTPDSRDSKTGKAHKMIYLAGVLDESVRNTAEFVTEKYSIVVSQDLFNALSSALSRFMEELEKDELLKNRVTARAGNFFATISGEFAK
jgi:hypothetical protein